MKVDGVGSAIDTMPTKSEVECDRVRGSRVSNSVSRECFWGQSVAGFGREASHARSVPEVDLDSTGCGWPLC